MKNIFNDKFTLTFICANCKLNCYLFYVLLLQFSSNTAAQVYLTILCEGGGVVVPYMLSHIATITIRPIQLL